MLNPTPSVNSNLLQQLGGFTTVVEALEYAAKGETGFNFYNSKAELVERLSYAELWRDAHRLARKLLGAGIKKGDRVAIIAETQGDFMRAFFGCQLGGMVPAPLPLPATFGGRAAYVAQIRQLSMGCGAVALFGPSELEAFVREAAEGNPQMRVVGTLAALDDFSEAVALPEIKPADISYLQFSSGSTRFPLAVAVTHGSAMSNTTAIIRYGLRVVLGDRCSSWLPLYHDMGLIGFMITPIASQLSVDYIATREFARRPFLWLRLISMNRASLAYSPSFGYDLCARRARTASIEGIDLSSWRCAGIGADMIRPAVLEEFERCFQPCGFKPGTFIPSYGLAEVTLAISFTPVGQGFQVDRLDLDGVAENVARPADARATRIRDFVLCGQPLAGHQIEVRGEDGNVVEPRQIGRIYIKGPSLMKEYFGKPDETRAVLSIDGWLDTGDLGYWCNGQIVITGRVKDLIIVNGRNIWPQDLEWTVEKEVEGVRPGDVAAISLDTDERERVLLLVECRLRKEEQRAELKARIIAAISAGHGVECDVVLLAPNSLPQTSSGKLSRSRAKQNYLRGDLTIAETAVAS